MFDTPLFVPPSLVGFVLIVPPLLIAPRRLLLPRTTTGLSACFLIRSAYANSRSSRVQGLQEGGTERVVGAWVQGGGGRGAYFISTINQWLVNDMRERTTSLFILCFAM